MTPIELVQKLLNQTPYEAFLFGSRANGTSRITSDWDIAIIGKEKLNPILLMEIEEAIEKANFLQKVDLVDVFTASPALRKEIEKVVLAIGK
jgi:predicted nucleotidyltransferase